MPVAGLAAVLVATASDPVAAASLIVFVVPSALGSCVTGAAGFVKALDAALAEVVTEFAAVAAAMPLVCAASIVADDFTGDGVAAAVSLVFVTKMMAAGLTGVAATVPLVFVTKIFTGVAAIEVTLGLVVAVAVITFDFTASGRAPLALAAASLAAAAAAAIGPVGLLLYPAAGGCATVKLFLMGVCNCDIGTTNRRSWTDHLSPTEFSLSANSALSLCF